jgi:hypothetical protein
MLPLPIQVGMNRFSNLNAAKLVFAAWRSHHRKDFDAGSGTHELSRPSMDIDHKADFVLIQIAGIVVKIIAIPTVDVFLRIRTPPLHSNWIVPSGRLWND